MNQNSLLRENLIRFAASALICFSVAVLIYLAVFTVRMQAETANTIAALGVAWWVVGSGLTPFAAYFAWRRAQIESD